MNGFSYTPDALRDLAKEWQDLAIDYEVSMYRTSSMSLVRGPGHEIASESHAHQARCSGNAYLQSLENKAEYCWKQADKFQETLDEYLGVEHRNVRELHNSGPRPVV